jgi:hypothetical protein
MPQELGRLASLRNRLGHAAAIMICSERERLLRSYHTAVTAYAEVVSQLKNADTKEFPKQFALADAAREKCDRLRESIDQHRATHGC